MGHKIFVSYKYADSDVKQLTNSWRHDTVRTYVDKLEEYISKMSEHIYKGETDGDDLSGLSDDAIWTKLKDRIYDSTLTIVMISKGMRQTYLPDREQWIPWEISYSLKEVYRKNISDNMVKSSSNALLAIILPDTYGSYEYFTFRKTCCLNPCCSYKTNFLFEIMRKNMFNIKRPNNKECDDGSIVYYGDSSYMTTVKWEDFIKAPETYIDKAYDIQSKIEQYDVCKELD
ncbi:MAG: TIR domain-containing protein [Clostridia bacterium]|nr:TIR domain-containing protein [Clostridia bacterium]